MADDDLRAEYDELLARLDGMTTDTAVMEVVRVTVVGLRHILKRLGPPEPLDGIEAETLTEREA